MNDDSLMEQMKESLQDKTNEVVLVEFPLSSTELHNIANGGCKQLNDRECPFSIRFMLKDSFKSSRSDFVINKFVVQIVVAENKEFLKKENIATRVKIVARDRKKKEKIKEEITVEESEERLF